MRLSYVLCFLAAFALATAAQAEEGPAAAAPQEPPRLVVAISVDQLSADLFAQYRRHFAGGLARLQDGAVFPSGYQGHAATETCPGHSTLLTGTHPARNGIIANNWFDLGVARAEKKVYCAEDETDPASSPKDPVVSAVHLKVPTLGDLLKQRDARSRNVAVAGKDRAAVMMGGHSIDAAYWWKARGFASFAGRALSPAAAAANRKAAALIESGAEAFAVPAWCAPRDRAVPVKDFTIGTWRFPLAPGQSDAFRVSPRLDAATADLAVALVDEMGLGADAVPDVLSVGLSATDYIGHAFGHEGAEMCIQLAQVDAMLGRIFSALDERGIDYVAVLTADHGAIDAPERLRLQGYARAARADAGLTAEAMSQAVTAATGIAAKSGPLLYSDGAGGDVYISATLSAADKAKVSAALIDWLKAHPQVAAAFTGRQLAAQPMPSGAPQDWSLIERARASFDAKRSGDIVVLLERAVVAVIEPRPGVMTTHGSPWDYDRRVPVLFWRRGIAGFEQPAPIATVDIAPTLAAVLGLKVPEGAFDGTCRDIDGGERNTCAGE